MTISLKMSVNKKAALVLTIIGLMASCITPIQPGKAGSKTIVVPDDYPTISSAIGNATDGDTIFVKKGTYEGLKDQTLVINKTISLIGEDAKNTKINLHPRWDLHGFRTGPLIYSYDDSLMIQVNDVKISGFTITSERVNDSEDILVGGGVILVTGNRTQIIGNIIETQLNIEGGSNHTITENTLSYNMQFWGSYSSIARNSVVGSSIVVQYGGYSNMIYGNTVTDSSGIHVIGSGNRVFNNTVKNCSEGVGVFKGAGVLGADGSNNIFCSNRVISNTLGLVVEAEGSNNVFYANYVANNRYGAAVRRNFPPGDSTFYHNNFVDNTEQVNTDPIIVLADGSEWTAYHTGYFDNGKEGNYWSDYNGIDSNGDGIGDTQYVIDANRQDNYPLMAPFDISSVTIELPEWVSPEPQPEPESFPTIRLIVVAIVVAAVVLVAAVGVGLSVYLNKHK